MDIKKKIQYLIDKNEVCLFMKGTPDTPQCGFSMAVSNFLKHLKVSLIFLSQEILTKSKFYKMKTR